MAQTDVPFNPGNGHRPETLRAGDPGIEPDEFGEALRLLIRSKLNDGRLPYDSMPRFWGGPGDGEQCDVCDTLITKEQLVMEALPPYSPARSLFNFTSGASTPGMPSGACRSRSLHSPPPVPAPPTSRVASRGRHATHPVLVSNFDQI